ncbi:MULTISPECIES: phospho-sugar mutase [Lysinibacillus]|uniref:phospho-sugar mutase n=1 Tax=Lysinibacillus TaxID=400634 RepID=UPI00214B13EF|nr:MULTISPECIES: phospho-sugar mutase [Lysinibacillus]UUV25151.1 phospho-sugar mutase [Lysinibacillus sp. FN11]UYB48023.1 phospho-sugar mutase [Lysinibacillus capsici]
MYEQYHRWLEKSNYIEELTAIKGNTAEITERFYQIIPFGTGGIRGKLGAGINRINVHTIRLVAEGLARQIAAQGDNAKLRGVVIAYDTRHFSKEFAYETAGVLASHGIQSYVFSESRPTPELSFGVRYLAAFAGVVITASHNPKQYNGFKVYGEDGAQLTPQIANQIEAYMNDVEDIFEINSLEKSELPTSGYCVEILDNLDDSYAQALKKLSLRPTVQKDVSIVYTPLHGAGLVPTMRGLKEFGFTNVHIVTEQAKQDGEFPTVAYPNPEESVAFKMSIELGQKVNADLLLATDPDADRLGVAIWSGDKYKLLTGNQLGALLLYYILKTHKENGTLPANAAMIKTIVTSELGTMIADSFGVTTINTLTGFKYIAEQIAEFEATGSHTFLFGYEESYGYLAGDFVRDKDAVQIALLTAEMVAFYKEQNKSLLDALEMLYEQFGYFQEKLISFTFDGLQGQQMISSIMHTFRENQPKYFADIEVIRFEDYQSGQVKGKEAILALPKADVLKYILKDGSWICIRPSGTEPKCKFYIGVRNENEATAHQTIQQIEQSLQALLAKLIAPI